MKIAACIIAYHPNARDLEKDIRAIAGGIETLIIWRNSPEAIPVPDDIPCQVVYMGDGTNQFISKPLNICLKYCDEHGFDFLLTMDQDSEFEDFGRFLASAKATKDGGTHKNAIVYAPNINNRYALTPEPISVESTITSGSLCDVRSSLAIGGFREKYGIYWVDSEFCHRARLAGYDILALPEHNLRQQFGKKTKVHGVDCYNYSAQTYYFMFRNMLWMHREYKVNPSLRCILYTSQMYLKSILIGEKDKWKKLCSVWRGIWQGLFKSYQ